MTGRKWKNDKHRKLPGQPKCRCGAAYIFQKNGEWVHAPMEENTNCLAGMKCPKCKSLGPYTMSVHIQGTAEGRGRGDMRCPQCDNEMTQTNFSQQQREAEQRMGTFREALLQCPECGYFEFIDDFKGV